MESLLNTLKGRLTRNKSHYAIHSAIVITWLKAALSQYSITENEFSSWTSIIIYNIDGRKSMITDNPTVPG